MSTKPEKVSYYSQALTIDGVVAHRVQRFGSSSDISREKIQELANSGAVEWRANIPNVSITMDTYDIGSTDTMALVCDRMIDKSLAAEANGPRGGQYRYYIKMASSNAANRDITHLNMLTAYCDFMTPITENGTTISRTMWIHRAALTGLSFSYDVNGFASENYTFSSDNKRWFLNGYKNARVYKVHNVAQIGGVPNGDATTQPWQEMDSAIPDGATILYYCKNDQIYGNASAGGFVGTVRISAPVSGGFSVHTSGSSLDSAAATDNVHFVYIPKANTDLMWDRPDAFQYSTGPGYDIESYSTSFGALGRAYISAYLYNTDGPFGETTSTAVGATLRLQTVNGDMSFTEEQLLQLSYKRAYGVSRIDPTLTITVTANDSDLDMFAKSCATSDAAAKTFSLDDFSGANNLIIKAYKDENKSILLRTVSIYNMTVVGENHDVSVGGNAVQEFTFTADNFLSEGSGVSLTGY